MSSDLREFGTRRNEGGRFAAPLPPDEPVKKSHSVDPANAERGHPAPRKSPSAVWRPILAKASIAVGVLAGLALIGHGVLRPPSSDDTSAPLFHSDAIGARADSPSLPLVVPSFASAPAASGETDPASRAGSESPATAASADPPSAVPTEDPRPHAGGRARLAPGEKVVLNTATEEDLTKLPGVGRVRARAILAVRARLGRFHALQDLMRVKGIGRKTLQRLRPYIAVDVENVSSSGGRGDAGAN